MKVCQCSSGLKLKPTEYIKEDIMHNKPLAILTLSVLTLEYPHLRHVLI